MFIDVEKISPLDGYKLITNLIVPRPIAWVTSRNENGSINLAPFSFFNAMGSNPLLVVICVGMESAGVPKHTAKNILRTKEFVINMVTPELIDAMNISAADFPEGMSELEAAGLHTIESIKITVPRLAEAKVSFECKLHTYQQIGPNNLLIGTVHAFHVEDSLIGNRFHINGFTPIGRLGSPSQYCTTTDRFDLPRMSYSQWLEKPNAIKPQG